VSLLGNRRRVPASHPVWFFVACSLALTPAFAADAAVKLKSRETLVEQDLPVTSIKIDVPLVLINVTVTDPMNRFVTGLYKENFQIKEDKVEQTITQFGAEDAPLSMGIVFDASGSMGYKMSKAREAVAQFFKTANPEDEFFLAQFNDRPQMATGFTNSLEEIQNELTFMQSGGRTALLDAIYLALNKMKEAKNAKKALLVISDGGDNSSRYGVKDIKSAVRESDVQLYAIGIFDPDRGTRGAEYAYGPYLLSELSEMTGGRMFPVELYSLHELPDLAAKISVELRNQYIVGYRPSNTARDGSWRRIKVKLKPPKGLPQLYSYARSGYYAPTH